MRKKIRHIFSTGNRCSLVSAWCLFFITTFSTFIFSQEYTSLQFSDASSVDILKTLESTLAQTINYSHDLLPEGRFNFSASGGKEELLQVVFNVLDREYVVLDEDVIVVSRSPLSDEKKIVSPIISGTMVNEKGEILPYAQIISTELSYLATSDQHGRYTIEGFYADEEEFTFTYLGYQKMPIKYKTLIADPNISLTEKDHKLTEIIIRDQLISPDIASGYEIVDKADIDLSQSGYQDVIDMSLLESGIFNSGESVSELQIRGGPTDQVGIEWNGIRLFQTSLLYGKISSVNPLMVKQLEISKNGGDASESGQASGMLRFNSHNQLIDTFAASIHTNLLFSNLGIQVPLLNNKVSLKAAYRFSQNKLFDSKFYQNNIDAVFQQSDILNDRDFYRELGIIEDFSQELDNGFSDANISIQYNPTDKDQFSASYISVRNDLTYKFKVIGTDDEPFSDLFISNSGFSTSYDRQWASWIETHMAYSSSNYNQDHYKLIPFTQESVIYNRVSQETIDASIKLKSKFGQLKIGAQILQAEALGLDSLNHQRHGVLEYNRFSTSGQEYSAFAQYSHSIFNRIHLNAGLRFSDYDLLPNERRILEPKIHMGLDLTNNIKLHGHYAKSHQIFNSFLYGISLQAQNDFYYLANTKEDNSNYILRVRNELQSIGVSYQNQHWLINIDLYRKTVNDVQTTALDLRWYEDLFTFAQIKIKGAEASLKYQSEKLSIVATYQHVDEEVRYNDNFEEVFRSPHFQPHRISIFQSLVLHPFTINLQWKYATGRLYSVPSGIDIEYNDFFQADDYFPFYESRFDRQIRDYHNLDVNLFYELPLMMINAKVGFHMNNVYQRDNVLQAYHVINYANTPATTDYFERNGLPFSYNVSLDLRF